MSSSQELSPRAKNLLAMEPSRSFTESSGGFSPRAPVIRFVSNVIVGDGDAVAASLSACPSTRSSSGSSSEIEIEVLFQGGDDNDDDCTAASPAAAWSSRSTSFRGCSDGEVEDLEAGTSRLLRASSLNMVEFVERGSTGELRWSAIQGLASGSLRSNAGQFF